MRGTFLSQDTKKYLASAGEAVRRYALDHDFVFQENQSSVRRAGSEIILMLRLSNETIFFGGEAERRNAFGF